MAATKRKILGTVAVEATIVLGIMMLITVFTFKIFFDVREKLFFKPLDRLGLIYHLTLSNEMNNNTLLLKSDELLPLQKKVITTLNCATNYCRVSEYRVPHNAFTIIQYNKQSMVEDIKIYFPTSNYSSIFSFNKRHVLTFNDDFLDNTAIFDANPDFKYILDTYQYIKYEYYLDNDLKHPISKEICSNSDNSSRCLYVLHYNKKILTRK